MVPLIYTDMRAQFSSRVFCTDASEFGGGACETISLTTAGVAAGREEAVRAGSSSSGEISAEIATNALVLAPQASRPQGVRFEFSVERLGAHTNELELRALFTMLRGLARSSGNIGMRFAVLVDSLVVLGIAPKGRSCSRRLNSTIRRLNAHVLAYGFYVFFAYVASDANPADEASRCHEPK